MWKMYTRWEFKWIWNRFLYISILPIGMYYNIDIQKQFWIWFKRTHTLWIIHSWAFAFIQKKTSVIKIIILKLFLKTVNVKMNSFLELLLSLALQAAAETVYHETQPRRWLPASNQFRAHPVRTNLHCWRDPSSLTASRRHILILSQSEVH